MTTGEKMIWAAAYVEHLRWLACVHLDPVRAAKKAAEAATRVVEHAQAGMEENGKLIQPEHTDPIALKVHNCFLDMLCD